MITQWVIASMVFAALLAIAAFATERALRALKLPTRGPWIAAITVSLMWPLVVPIASRLMPHAAPAGVATITGAAVTIGAITPVGPSAFELWTARANGYVIAAWIMASVLLTVRLLLAARALARLRRAARATTLDGHPVLLTESLGPAVIGLRNPRVAVPSWMLQLDEPLRALVLRHEREHCQSRDPQLVWLAAVAVALMPWNIALWWQTRRLRLALEIDCDARTLRREADPAVYSKLLLLIAQRQSGYPLASMLAESNSHLSRRISAMHTSPAGRPHVRVLLSAAAAVGAIAVACSPRVASDLTAPQTTAPSSMTKTVAQGPVYFEYQVEKPVARAKNSAFPKYPEHLKAEKVDGQVNAQFVVNELGLVELGTFKVLGSNNPEFTKAVQDALPDMRFEPASIGGRLVKQLVQQPFLFMDHPAYLEPVNVVTPSERPLMVPGKNDGSVMVPSVPVKPGVQRDSVAVMNTVSPLSEPRPITAPAGNLVPPTRTLPTTVSPNGEDRPYFEFQVEKRVTLREGSAYPKYPESLLAQKISGTVLAQFVVDQDGMPVVSSFKALLFTDQAFVDAVKAALPDMRFVPAMVGDKAVKQLVQVPIQFPAPK